MSDRHYRGFGLSPSGHWVARELNLSSLGLVSEYTGATVEINALVLNTGRQDVDQPVGSAATQLAAFTTAPCSVTASIIASTARAGTINLPRIFTAGNSPAAIARYNVIADNPNIAAASDTL
jgi:hypothetical protein